MNLENHPSEIDSLLSGENPDFIVKSKHKASRKTGLKNIGIGLFLLIFISPFIFVFIMPLLSGEEVHFTSQKTVMGKVVEENPVSASLDNIKPAIAPLIALAIFILTAIYFLYLGIFQLISEGPWYIGTPKRLIAYEKNKTTSFSWTQFSEEVQQTGTDEKGNIILKQKMDMAESFTSVMMKLNSKSRNSEADIAKRIHIIDIKNASSLVPIIEQRINENKSGKIKSVEQV